MDTEEMLDAIDSFIAGFGKRQTGDCQNAVFIAMKLFNLDVPLEYNGMGRSVPPEEKTTLYEEIQSIHGMKRMDIS